MGDLARTARRLLLGAWVAAGATGACSTAYSVNAGDAGPGGGNRGDASVHGDASSSPADAAAQDASVDASSADGGSGTSMCNVATPFDTIKLLNDVNDGGDNQNLRLSHDYLTGYFTSTRDSLGELHLYSAARATLASPFTGIAAMASLNASGSADARSTVTGDGLGIYFHSTRLPEGLWFASRTKPTDAFPPPIAVSGATGFDSPFVREDGNVLYFVTNAIIRVAPVSSPGALGPDAVVTGLGPDGTVTAPTVTPDDLVIYYASTRTEVNAGGFDIWYATRATPSAPWGKPVHADELGTTGDDKPSFISRDLCTLYVYRTDAAGNTETWVATRTPK